MATININRREVVKTKRNGRVIESKNIFSSYSSPATNTIDWAEVTPDLITINRDLKVTGNITATEDVIAYVAGAVSSDVLSSLSVNAPLEKVGTSNIKLNINPAQMQVNGSNQLEVIPGILAPAAHSHLVSDVTGLQTSLDSKLSTSLKGAVNGLAELDSTGKILSSQLPSYVDDVLEVASSLFFPATGESGKIYITANDNKTYRWSGSAYTEISASLALGVTSSTAYRGDLGNIAYNHSQVTHDKNLVGLGNVDNTSDASKPISTATQTALDLKAPLASPAFTGYVGINVASPTVPLQIAYESNALDSVNPLVVGSFTTGANKVGIYTKIYSSSPFGGGYVFKTYKRNVGAYDAVTIDDTGNVGINGNLTVGSNINYAGTLNLTKTVDGYNIVNLRGTTNYPSRFVLYGAGDTTIQASISQAGYGDTYFKSAVGIGTTTPTGGKLEVLNGVAGALPATTGTTSTAIACFGSNDTQSQRLYIGTNNNNSIYGAWLQVSNSTNLSLNYPLVINPNGGNVGIGYSSGTEITNNRLAVNGSGYFNGTVTSNNLTVTGGATVTNTVTASSLSLTNTDADILKNNTTGQIRIGGGTSASSSTGAVVQVFGNDYATAQYKGQVRLIAGKGDGTANFGSISLNTVNAAFVNTERLKITGGNDTATAAFTNCNVTVSGSITAGNEVTAFSDKRLKSNIQPLNVRGNLKPVTYIKDGKESIGFIAQDVKEIYPELVVGDESKEMLSLNYQQLTAVLYAEILELKERIKKLEGDKNNG